LTLPHSGYKVTGDMGEKMKEAQSNGADYVFSFFLPKAVAMMTVYGKKYFYGEND
jgi:hypothetical protein